MVYFLGRSYFPNLPHPLFGDGNHKERLTWRKYRQIIHIHHRFYLILQIRFSLSLFSSTLFGWINCPKSFRNSISVYIFIRRRLILSKPHIFGENLHLFLTFPHYNYSEVFQLVNIFFGMQAYLKELGYYNIKLFFKENTQKPFKEIILINSL